MFSLYDSVESFQSPSTSSSSAVSHDYSIVSMIGMARSTCFFILSCHILYSTQLYSTQLYSTQLNSTQLYSTLDNTLYFVPSHYSSSTIFVIPDPSLLLSSFLLCKKLVLSYSFRCQFHFVIFTSLSSFFLLFLIYGLFFSS